MTAAMLRLAGPSGPDRPSLTPSAASKAGLDDRLEVFVSPRSYGASQYHALRHLIEEGHSHGGVSILAVTSPEIGDGKTTTAINLAGALAQTPGARVLLVDGDLRRPSIARRLGLEHDDAGLVEAILDRGLSLAAVARPYAGSGLAVVRAGRLAESAYEVLHSPRLGDLLQEARGHYDYVVVDTAPLLPIPDARIIGKWVDGFLVVVYADRTPRKTVEESLNLMVPDKVVGLVFNGDQHTAARRDYQAYAAGPVADTAGSRWPSRLAASLRRGLSGGATPWR